MLYVVLAIPLDALADPFIRSADFCKSCSNMDLWLLCLPKLVGSVLVRQ